MKVSALLFLSLCNSHNPFRHTKHNTAQTRDNVRFAMSQELAQDEAEADAEDYEIDAFENGHRRLATHDDEDDFEDGEGEDNGSAKGGRGGPRGEVGDESVVFAMGEDSDDEGSEAGGKRANGFRDEDGDGDGEVRKGPKGKGE